MTSALNARGELDWKLEYNPDDIVGETLYMLLADDRVALIDHSDVSFAIDLMNRKSLGFVPKTSRSFMVAKSANEIFIIKSNVLFPISFESFTTKTRKYYHIIGFGESSDLTLLIPDAESFIVASHFMGDPREPKPVFRLRRIKYADSAIMWFFGLDAAPARPPVTTDGRIVVARDGEVSTVNMDGKVQDEFKIDCAPRWCAIGPDDHIYMLGSSAKGTFLYAVDFKGNTLWKHRTLIKQTSQPPIVGNDSLVYLVGLSKIEAYAREGKKWEYKLSGKSDLSKQASVTQDGVLLVADGNRVVALDKTGRTLWTYKDSENGEFCTQPVLDSKGRVYVATNKKMVAIK